MKFWSVDKMFTVLKSINVLKYLVPAALAFMLGFYLAETVTTKIYSKQQTKLKEEHKLIVDSLQARITSLVQEQNSLADKLNATSSALAEANITASAADKADSHKALVRYKEKIVLVKQSCVLSDPGLDFIKDNIVGK